MKPVMIVVAVAACAGPDSTFRIEPLPALVVPHPTIKSLQVHELLLTPGEHLTYEVHVHGMTIGRAELEVGETNAHARFSTESFVAAFEPIHDDQTTILDRGGARAASSSETIDIAGETHHFETEFGASTFSLDGKSQPIPGGNIGQTIVSALGVVRAWAAPDAPAGLMTVVVQGRAYIVEIKQPTVEDLQSQPALRVDGTIHTAQPVALVMWLANTPVRTPLRIELSNDDFHVVADLVVS